MAGTDTVCEVQGSPPYTDVIGAYNQSLLSEEVVDRALRRLYEGLVRVGYFDPASASSYRSLGWSQVNTPESQALAIQSATDGLVLLKNDGILPAKLEGKTVALIGHWANGTRSMLGGYSGVPPFYHGPVYAAEQLNLTYNYATGPIAPSNITKDTWTANALAAAGKSDVILYFGGTDQSVASEDKDRDSIAWPDAQLTLVQALAGLGKPVIVVQLGDQVDDTPLLQNANISAILFAGYPGQSGGTAVLNALTGVSAPAGRLPVTQYPASYAAQVPMTDMSLRPNAASGNPGRTYRWYPQKAAVLPFGYGLHYTNFTTRLSVAGLPPSGGPPPPPPPPPPSCGAKPPHPPRENPHEGPSPTVTTTSLLQACKLSNKDLCPFPYPVTVEVTNTGKERTSDYVALVFVQGEFGPAPYPLKTLVGYKRVRGVKPGQTARAEVQIKLGDLARVDGQGNTVLYPGKWRFVVDVDGQGKTVEVEVGGKEVVLDTFPQPK